MARWRLQVAHYLLTDPPAEWEHREVSRETGRQTTVKYKVPTYLDSDAIVCNGNNQQRDDTVFIGDPTPDMEPLDDEAKAITKKFVDSGKWKKPEEGMLHGEMLIKDFMEQISRIQAQPIPVQPVSSAAIDAKAFADLQIQVQALMEQNAKLQAQASRRM